MYLGIIFIVSLIEIKPTLCKNNASASLAISINKFGENLYKQLAKEEGNIVFCPFSLHASLSFLALGTDGKTRKELVTKLLLTNVESLETGYSMRANNPTLQIANNLFFSKTLTLLGKFKRKARSVFQANPQGVDFSLSTKVAEIINKWTSSHTNKKIRTIIDKDSINDQTMAILLNVIYFKGKWKKVFSTSQTIKNNIFHTPRGNVKCNMMVMMRQKFNFFEDLKFTYLEIPFQNSSMQMVFIKPEFNVTMRELEETVNYKAFCDVRREAKLRSVDIFVPKFKLHKEYLLNQYIKKIGISDIFKAPDFSNLFEGNKPAKVDKVLQNLHLDLDEGGVTAAVATSVTTMSRAPRPRAVFDKPFLFFLYDSNRKIILIRGRITNPTA